MTDPAPHGPALRLLGQPAWSADGRHWQPLSRKDAVLLALLALQGAQARGRLAALLWPGVPAPRANANLRQRLFRLRQQAAALVEERADTLTLAPGLHCDLRDDDGAAEAGLLDALPDADDELQAWIDDARRLWDAEAGTRLAARAARLEAAGELAAAIAVAERLVALDPLQEHAWRLLMQLHAQRRDRAAALAAFERCERLLRDELGVRPSPPTLALLHRIETLAPAALPPAGLPPALLRPPPMVGREAERAAMQAAWAAGRPFLLLGDAGLGKSRLLGAWAAAHEGAVLESARPGDEHVAYGVLVRLLRALQRAAPRPDALWPAGAARAELARLLPDLGPPPAAPGLPALLHDAVEQVLARAPAAGLHAVLLDDLQHADDASRVLLARLLATPGLRWGLASRPDARLETGRWQASSARLVHVMLAPLDEPALQALLAGLQVPGLDLPALAPALRRHCGGNPLFLLETLRHLAARGQADPAQLPLPASVQALLAERLARLPAEALALARVAAVAGPDFDGDVACDALALPPLGPAAPWQALQAAQVLEGERFVHASLQDALLAELPPPLRAPLHAAVAASLQRRGAPPERVLRHFVAARRWPEAAAAALAAADQALRLGRMEERLQRLDEAAAWFDAAGQPDAALRTRITGAGALLATQGPRAAADRLDALAGAVVAPQDELALHLQRAALALQDYAVPQLLVSARAALAGAAAGSEARLRALALLAAGQAWSGERAGAAATLQQLMPGLEGVHDAWPAAELWSHVAMTEHALGRPAACVAALEHQRRHAHAAGHVELEASALASLSGQRNSLGDAELAVELAESAARLQRRMGAEHTAALSELNLVIALAGTGHLARALDVTQAVQQQLRDTAAASDLLLIAGDLRADIWLRLDDAEAARAELAEDPGTANPARVVNRLGLRACAADGTAGAAAAWHALASAMPPEGQGGVRLRWQLELARRGHAVAVDVAVRQALEGAAATGLVALEGLAWLVQAEAALANDDREAALAAVRTLQPLRPRLRHLYIDEARLRSTVCRVLDTAGCADEAAAERAAARAWIAAEQLPALPATHRARWLARADLAALA